jgi:uncharacterized protein
MIEVRHNQRASRFESGTEPELSRLDYVLRGEILDLYHAEVPLQLEGRGIASAITKAALDWARENGRKVRPSCPFVSAWIRRHSEYSDLVL